LYEYRKRLDGLAAIAAGIMKLNNGTITGINLAQDPFNDGFGSNTLPIFGI
jgi:hypothetical protein